MSVKTETQNKCNFCSIDATERRIINTLKSKAGKQTSWRRSVIVYRLREGSPPKKNPKCKLFPKGGGSTPKCTFKKSLYTVNRGFKINFFNTRMCFGKFWEQQKKLWDIHFFLLKFFSKSFNFGGGGDNANLEKVYILDFFFFAPFP